MGDLIGFIMNHLPGDAWTYIVALLVWAIGRYVKLEYLQKILEPTAKIAGLFISKTILLIPKISQKMADNIESGFFSTLLKLVSWYAGRIDYWMRSDNIVKAIVSEPLNIEEKIAPKYSVENSHGKDR